MGSGSCSRLSRLVGLPLCRVVGSPFLSGWRCMVGRSVRGRLGRLCSSASARLGWGWSVALSGLLRLGCTTPRKGRTDAPLSLLSGLSVRFRCPSPLLPVGGILTALNMWLYYHITPRLARLLSSALCLGSGAFWGSWCKSICYYYNKIQNFFIFFGETT